MTAGNVIDCPIAAIPESIAGLAGTGIRAFRVYESAACPGHISSLFQ